MEKHDGKIGKIEKCNGKIGDKIWKFEKNGGKIGKFQKYDGNMVEQLKNIREK